MIDRDADISYYDNGFKTITVTRNRYGRLKDFHKSIYEIMKSIFKTRDVTQIEVYYRQYNQSVLFTKSDIIDGKYQIIKLKHKRGHRINEEE